MFDCVIPSAGASSRMAGLSVSRKGGPGEARLGEAAFKPLLPFAGSTLVETSVLTALGAGARVLLVVGKRGEEVAGLFDAEPYLPRRELGSLVIVDNPDWEEGMLGSIQSALHLVRGDAFFIAHADMPFIASADYRVLAAAWERRAAGVLPETAILASHGGLEGHPVLLPSSWIPDILALEPGDRIKRLIARRPRVLVETGPGALRDIDTPEDYTAAVSGPRRGSA